MRREEELEASVLANPSLLDKELRPNGATICRQVPISPLKPLNQIDRADICYYRADAIAEGSIPNVVIELKIGYFGRGETEQVLRYVKWLRKRLGDESRRIIVHMLARSYSRDWSTIIPPEYRTQIRASTYPAERVTRLNMSGPIR